MSALYKVLVDLCAEHGITPYRMCKDTGIQPSVMTDLKMGRRQTVKAETAAKIANYFNVSVEYLIGQEPKEKAPTVEVDDERSAKRKMLFDLFNSMTDEELDAMIAFTNAIQKKIDEKKK